MRMNIINMCFHRSNVVATLVLGSRPRRGLTRVWAKTKRGSHISCSRECKRVWGKEPSHSQMNSHVGSWSPSGLLNLQRAIIGVKTQWFEKFFISFKSYWNVDV
jgi:hypothetical protein